MTSDEQRRYVTLNADDDISVDELVKLVSNAETATNPTELAPTSGRVVEDANNDDVYIGNGDIWLKLGDDVGVRDDKFVEGPGRRMASPGEDLQPVIDQVSAEGGGTVKLPQYNYVQTVDLPSHVELEGSAIADPNADENYGTTLQRPDGVNAAVIHVTEGDGGSTRVRNSKVRKINVDGNKSGSGTGSESRGIRVENPDRVTLEDLAVYDCADAGIRSGSGIVLRINDCNIRGNDSDGVFLAATSDFVVSSGDIGSNGRHGILITGANGFVGNGTNSFLNSGQGFRNSGNNNRFVGVRANDNDQDGIYASDVVRMTVTGSLIESNGGFGVLTEGSSDYNRLTGNSIFANSEGQTSLAGSNSTEV